MHRHTFARLLAVAALLTLTPALGSAQSVTYDFSVIASGFTAASGWVHDDTPAAPNVGDAAWSISGQALPGQFALQTPAAGFTVTTAGPVTVSLTHRYNFGAIYGGEVPDPLDGGVLRYRVNGGSWFVVPVDWYSEGGPSATLPTDNSNPLGGLLAFGAQSNNFGTGYNTSTLTLNHTDTNAPFGATDTIHLQFVAAFGTSSENSVTDLNWQIGSVTLQDATPVPEPAGVLGLAALGFAGYRVRRRVTSALSSRKTAS